MKGDLPKVGFGNLRELLTSVLRENTSDPFFCLAKLEQTITRVPKEYGNGTIQQGKKVEPLSISSRY
ncbi:hypothetical protein AgCh_014013 [Apium graveolens]